MSPHVVQRSPLGGIALGVVLVVAGLAACSPLASKGTMPPPGPNGEVDVESAPEFIAVAGRDGSVVGYVRKELLLPAEGPGRRGVDPMPVYGEDLRTVVGQMVPGKGFVAVGVDPATVPDIPVQVANASPPPGEGSGQVALYVRNDGADQAWIAVESGGVVSQGTGFWGGNLGVGCYAMPASSTLVLLDGPPQDPASDVLLPIHTRAQEKPPPSLWISIGAGGAVTQGEGVAPWWSGGPQIC